MNHTIYFVRHGQTDWNAGFLFQGRQDIPINALGRRQAARNGVLLTQLLREPASFDFVASPLARTRQTMEIVRSNLGLDLHGYRTDGRLLELDYGDWEGMTLEEIRRSHGGMNEARNRNKWDFVPPGESAESYAMQAARFEPWLDEVSRNTVCVTHGGILRCAWKIATGISADEAGQLIIPQDRILRLKEHRLEWL